MMTKRIFAKNNLAHHAEWAKSLIVLEAGVGIEPASTALQAAA